MVKNFAPINANDLPDGEEDTEELLDVEIEDGDNELANEAEADPIWPDPADFQDNEGEEE